MSSLTSQQEEQEHHDRGVAEVEEGRSGSLDLQLCQKVVDAVTKQVERCASAGQKAPPPPVVVLMKHKMNSVAYHPIQGFIYTTASFV